jgi:hypothetical protein
MFGLCCYGFDVSWIAACLSAKNQIVELAPSGVRDLGHEFIVTATLVRHLIKPLSRRHSILSRDPCFRMSITGWGTTMAVAVSVSSTLKTAVAEYVDYIEPRRTTSDPITAEAFGSCLQYDSRRTESACATAAHTGIAAHSITWSDGGKFEMFRDAMDHTLWPKWVVHTDKLEDEILMDSGQLDLQQRDAEWAFLRSFMYPPPLAVATQLDFRLGVMNSVNKGIAIVRHTAASQWPATLVREPHATLWTMGACAGFFDGTLNINQILQSCPEYGNAAPRHFLPADRYVDRAETLADELAAEQDDES